MDTKQLQPSLASELIPVITLLVITFGWVVIFLNILKIHKIIIKTNSFIRSCIKFSVMNNEKKIKLSRTLLQRRDCDYISDPYRLLQFQYSCLIPKAFHSLPQPNLNFKLHWVCDCGFQPDPDDNDKTCSCSEASIRVDLIDSVKLVRESPLVPRQLTWHTPQDLPHDLRKK